MKKKYGKWRVCVDFTDLNRVCPKDPFPMSKIDQLVDATYGHSWMSFLDAFQGYHQIALALEDREKITFISPDANYHYTMILCAPEEAVGLGLTTNLCSEIGFLALGRSWHRDSMRSLFSPLCFSHSSLLSLAPPSKKMNLHLIFHSPIYSLLVVGWLWLLSKWMQWEVQCC